MKKFCLIISMLVAFGLLSISTTFAQIDVPDWSVVASIPRDAGHQVTIIEDLTGYPTPSDTGPYALGWVGGSKSNYCNTDRDFDFYKGS